MKRFSSALKSFGLKFTLILFFSMLFSAALSDLLISRADLKNQFAQLRDKLMVISQEASLLVDTGALAKIPLTPEGEKTQEYMTVERTFKQVKSIDPSITYIYILTKTRDQGILRFVVDLDDDDPNAKNKKSARPGDLYDASRFPEMLKAFEGPQADKELSMDEWGLTLSGYAPLKDAAGKTIAILGIDMSAPAVRGMQNEIHQKALIVLLIGIFISLIAGILISRRIAAPVNDLIEGAVKVASGNLGTTVSVKGNDEIATLGNVFNKMSKDLVVYTEELKRVTAERERFLKELEIAKRIQESFLPEHTPKLDHFDIAAVCIPAKTVGGDFYDFIPISPAQWGIAIGDASGKGMPAALFMALSRTLLKATAKGNPDIEETIRHANELICEDDKSNMFVTLFYAILDAERSSFKYMNAGHNPPFLMREVTHDAIFLKTDGIPMGLFPKMEFSVKEMVLKKGDIVTLYTDGVTEALNGKHEQFETGRLAEIVNQNRTKSAAEILLHIQDALKDFTGTQPQFDDITLMVVKVV